MQTKEITAEERTQIEKYFEKPLEGITRENLKELYNEARKKYHPDKFAHFDDDTVQEMATERFQKIETLYEKIVHYLDFGVSKPGINKDGLQKEDLPFEVEYAYSNMLIEIRSRNKDMKYHLFGSSYRSLHRGEKFKIPGTGASLIADESHRGTSVGFVESVKLYLTFGPSDSIEEIVDWFYRKIAQDATGLTIERKRVNIDREAIIQFIRSKSVRQIGAGE